MTNQTQTSSGSSVLFSVLQLFLRLWLGWTFFSAGLGKLANPAGFAGMSSGFQMLPGVTLPLFSLWLPMMELTVGALVLVGPKLRWSAAMMAGLLSMFLIALGQAVIRDLPLVAMFGGAKAVLLGILKDTGLLLLVLLLAFKGSDRWIWNLFRKKG